MDKKDAADISDIKLSTYTQALLDSLKLIKNRPRPDDFSKLTVSQTVSFFALLYERVRNVVEFREEHLVLRAAAERILKRRLAINPSGKEEAENLLRELLWARYFDNESLGSDDVNKCQTIIDNFLKLRKLIVTGRNFETQQYLSQFMIDLATSEIEESLKPESTIKNSSFTFFIYQVLRKKIKLVGLSDEQKDAFFLAAIEKAYRKSDKAYQRYHLFITFYKRINDYTENDFLELSTKLPAIFKRIDEIIASPYVENLTKYTRKQIPPFLILFDIIENKLSTVDKIFQNKSTLWSEVELSCRNKYQQLSIRLRNLAVKSFIYIVITKMAFALILEYPLSQFFYGEVNLNSIAINSIFPPILMAIIVLLNRIPGDENTRRIYQRIIDIIDADKSFETRIAYIPKKSKTKRPVLIFGFTIFYTLTFVITLGIIYEILSLLQFNFISELIFIFFVSVVTFFSFRIRRMVNEYILKEKEGILTPVIDFFFMPILSIGKFLSTEISRLNFFIFIFDFFIEAPFKLIFEVVEEWISFVRARKEEIM